jgi:uncharacterized membrane protein YhaH (DUF805 family)
LFTDNLGVLQMSKPVLDSIFNKELFSARRNRKSFILYLIAQFAVQLAGIVLIMSSGSLGGFGTFLTALVMAGGVAIIIVNLAVMGQRIRDIGYPGAWAIVIGVTLLVPLLNILSVASIIALMIVPGDTAVENKFGPSCI